VPLLSKKSDRCAEIFNRLRQLPRHSLFASEQGIRRGKTGNEYEIRKRPLFARLFCACRTRSVLTGLKGIDGLAMLVQAVLRQDPFSGHLFVFRGRKANLIKIVYWDGTGLCLFTKRLEQGVFLWPPDLDPGETLALSSEQLSMLIDGVDWRAPERRWRPAVAG
jgi:transposase